MRAALALAAAMMVAACAGAPQTRALLDGGAEAAGLPSRALVADVPFVAQEENYCGPASLSMALGWGGMHAGQAELAPTVFTAAREGSLTLDMAGAARRQGRLAVAVRGLDGLLVELAAGHPVIVFQNLALEVYPQWHFAVAVGYDLDQGVVLLHSGTEPLRRTSLATFEHTWMRAGGWALVVLPPDRLPAAASAIEVVEAAAALERLGHGPQARTAYVAILQRWPGQRTAWLGLGNVAWAAGDLPGAEHAWRRAIDLSPAFGAAWNNLAVLLAGTGRRDEAVEAARRAVASGEGDVEAFRATLADVTAGT